MKIARIWRRGIALAVATSMICAEWAWCRDTVPGANAGHSVFQPEFEGQAFEGLRWFRDQTLAAVPELEETNLAKLSKHDLLPTLQDLYGYYQRAMERFKFEHDSIGSEEFLKKLKTNQIFYQEPGYEKIKLTTIDDKPVARTVHGPSGVSVIFAEKSSIDRDSQHLRQYLSRQNFDAGRTRTDSQKRYAGPDDKVRKVKDGRDAILIWVEKDSNSLNTGDVEVHARPKPMTGEWWSKWWKATYKKPEKYNILTGVTFGLFQMATGYMISALVIGANPSPEAMEMLHVAGALNFLFGSTIGTWASFYHNWRRRGSVLAQAIKSSTVSIAFAISLKFLGPDGFATLNVFDPSLTAIASFQIFNMVQSMSATNLHKTAWYQWADVRSEARVDTDYFALPLPYGVGQREDGKFGVLTYKWKTPIKQSDVNRQIYAYMPVNMLRLIDLLIASLYVTEASQDWTVPFLSMAALWLLVPASYWANHYMAAKQYPDAAKVIGTQKAWDEIRKRFLPDWFLQKIEAASPSAAATIRGDFAQRELGKFPSLGEKALRLLGLGRDTGRSKCESLVGLIPDDLQ